MKTSKSIGRIVVLILSCAIFSNANAEVKMPAIFADNMVLQQQTNANMWGTATPNKQVVVTPSWTNKQYTTKSDVSGNWKLSIPTPKAGGPYEVVISDGKPFVLRNVLVGELWLCSGQSNMEMPMKGFPNQPIAESNKVVLHSKNPQIRLFTVQRNSVTDPVNDVTGQWEEASPKSVLDFSATAYFFGRQLQEILQVPVGLVVTAWGGSSCEAWMNNDMLKAFPEISAMIPKSGEKIKSKNKAPTVLYNGMLAPLVGLSMKGVIWYQGETNCEQAVCYADLFSTLIRGWRTLWNQGDFPFYYCQIAPYDYGRITGKGKEIVNSAFLREAQAKVEHMVPNVGMAVLMDAGFVEGIHPSNKRDPGERLALLALNKTYGIEGISGDSPYYKSMEVRNDTVVISFERDPLNVCGKNSFESKHFKVAGSDKVFYPAKAWIHRSNVFVKSEKVAKPVAVRYAFDNISDGDLFGSNGLPVSSFRSDDWIDAPQIKE